MAPRTSPSSLSPSPSLPSLHSYLTPNGTTSYLSLSDFLTSPHAADPTLTRASTAPPVESQTATRSGANSIDSVLARCATTASKRVVARQFHERESPIAREGMVEVNGELRGTHEALMRCLYAPGGVQGEIEEGQGDVGERGEGEYRWSPSREELKRVSGRREDGEDKEEKRETGSESDSERTVVQMRGGGVQEFLKSMRKPRDAKGGARRPEIISRPSDAFRHAGRDNVGVVVPGGGFEETRVGAAGPQDSRLLRVRQAGGLAPPSLFSSDGRLSSLAGSKETASIVPEGSIASFYVDDRTLHAPLDVCDSQVSLGEFLSPPPSSLGVGREPLPRELSPVRFDQSESMIRKISPAVELPTTELKEQRNNVDPPRKLSIRGSRQQARDGLSVDGRGGGEPSTVRKLGSPMQSPIRDTGDTWSTFDRSPNTLSHQSGSHPPSSGYVRDSQMTFFAPQSPASPGRSVVGSLRRNRRPLRESQVANPPLPPVDEQNSKPYLFPPGSVLSPDIALQLDNRATTDATEVDASNRSLWQGGSNSSIAPEDSGSVVWERERPRVPEAMQAPTGLQEHRGKETKLQNGGALQEVGEGSEAKGEAKARTEERFRDEVRRVWSHYQTRMRMINEDMEKTPQEKERAIKEEHRVLELLISQASTDTGFEHLHEPWQKDEVLRNLFGIQSKTSKTPTILRKANKIMKWFLAVPNDPELKTWSSRRRGVHHSQLAPSSLQRRATNATSSHPSQSTTARVGSGHDVREDGGVPRSSDQLGDFHFAPNSPVVAQAMRQPSFDTLGYGSQATSSPIKAGKAASETGCLTQSVGSSETGWPTQSQLGGRRGA